jgi:hypothetical protein
MSTLQNFWRENAHERAQTVPARVVAVSSRLGGSGSATAQDAAGRLRRGAGTLTASPKCSSGSGRMTLGGRNDGPVAETGVTRDGSPREPLPAPQTSSIADHTTAQGAFWPVTDVFPPSGRCADRMARYKMIRQRGTARTVCGDRSERDARLRHAEGPSVPYALTDRERKPLPNHPGCPRSARARTAGQIARGDGFAESTGEASRV